LVLETDPAETWAELNAIPLVYMGLGEKDAAIQAAEALYDRYAEAVYTTGPRAGIHLARILAHFGEHDRAIDLLEELLPSPSWLSVPMLEIDPIWDPLRNHPRFHAMLEEYRDDVER
jgi:serine/threonine-protein kinase